jgi:hypothetical protein
LHRTFSAFGTGISKLPHRLHFFSLLDLVSLASRNEVEDLPANTL